MTDEKFDELNAAAANYAEAHCMRKYPSGLTRDDKRWLRHYDREYKRLRDEWEAYEREMRERDDAWYREATPVRVESGYNRLGQPWRIEYRGFGNGYQRVPEGCEVGVNGVVRRSGQAHLTPQRRGRLRNGTPKSCARS